MKKLKGHKLLPIVFLSVFSLIMIFNIQPVKNAVVLAKSISVSEASGKYVVTTKALNVRAGNATNYIKLGSLKQGEVISITGKTENDWYQVYYNNKQGYVSSKYLEKLPEVNVTEFNGKYVVTTKSLNVRTGDSSSFDKLGSLSYETEVSVTGKTDNNWYELVYKGKKGYVSGKYLEKLPEINVTEDSGKYIVTAKLLNVRTGDTSRSDKIGTLSHGTEVSVTGKTDNNWYQITYQGKQAYVSGKHLEKLREINVTKASGKYVVTAKTLNIRTGNAANYDRLGSLSKGTEISITGKTDNSWYQINFQGKQGYVNGKYLEKLPEINVTEASGKYVVTTKSLNVRVGDASNYDKLGSLSRGMEVSITGKTDKNWYQITYQGKQGYVSGKYLERQKEISVVEASGKYIVTAKTLNVRTGNASSFDRLGALAEGAEVLVTGKTNNDWYQITYQGKQGYVSGKYIEKSPEINVTEASGKYVVTTKLLNVRAGDASNYDKLGSLSQGVEVSITGKTDKGWYQITYQGKQGYVSGKYIEKLPEIPEINVTEASGNYMVTAKTLNIRTGDGVKYDKLGSLSHGMEVSITGKTDNDWYRIIYQGKQGYVSGKHLSLINVENPEQDEKK